MGIMVVTSGHEHKQTEFNVTDRERTQRETLQWWHAWFAMKKICDLIHKSFPFDF